MIFYDESAIRIADKLKKEGNGPNEINKRILDSKAPAPLRSVRIG